MKCACSNVYPTFIVRIADREARSLSGPVYHAMPRRIFAYMAAELSVITGDLPQSKAIVAVPRDDPQGMGRRAVDAGRRPGARNRLAERAAVGNDYNWEHDAAEP
jgi:hypothetical protein